MYVHLITIFKQYKIKLRCVLDFYILNICLYLEQNYMKKKGFGEARTRDLLRVKQT